MPRSTTAHLGHMRRMGELKRAHAEAIATLSPIRTRSRQWYTQQWRMACEAHGQTVRAYLLRRKARAAKLVA